MPIGYPESDPEFSPSGIMTDMGKHPRTHKIVTIILAVWFGWAMVALLGWFIYQIVA